MNRALHERFQIERIDDLPESQFEEYLQAIKSYGFYYGNIYIGWKDTIYMGEYILTTIYCVWYTMDEIVVSLLSLWDGKQDVVFVQRQ